jgi:hypothetical protein
MSHKNTTTVSNMKAMARGLFVGSINFEMPGCWEMALSIKVLLVLSTMDECFLTTVHVKFVWCAKRTTKKVKWIAWLYVIKIWDDTFHFGWWQWWKMEAAARWGRRWRWPHTLTGHTGGGMVEDGSSVWWWGGGEGMVVVFWAAYISLEDESADRTVEIILVNLDQLQEEALLKISFTYYYILFPSLSISFAGGGR